MWGGWMIGIVTLVALGVLTFVLGIPAATLAVVVRLWPVWSVVGLLALGAQVGLLAEGSGPLGVPSEVFWLAVWATGAGWLWFFVRVTRAAWRSAFAEARMWDRAKRNIEGF